MEGNFHTSVLLREVADLLDVKSGKRYIDATLGAGGHASEIIRRGGIVLGIDADLEAIEYVRESLRSQELIAVQGNFRDIDKIAHSQGFDKVAGIIFDLGISSHQIEEARRGFSFQENGPLDMRMDQKSKKPTAGDVLNLANRDELFKIFNNFGEEPRARRLAIAIDKARKVRAFSETSDLLKVIEEVYGLGGKVSDKKRAEISKRVFQALRIAVNSELENLEEALPKAMSLLEAEGRLAVISFHSLEDRIVKHKFLDFQEKGLGKILTDKPVIPSIEEQGANRRSRSAKLRVFEKN